MTRRQFALTGVLPAMQSRARFRKGICATIFPKEMPLEEQFRQARSAGFEGLEIPLGELLPLDTDRDRALRLGDEARKAGIEIVSLWVSAPLSPNPLNHPDPAVRARGVEALRRAVILASWMDCGALLIVPGRLGTGPKFQIGYQDTWERVSAEMKKVVPEAEKARVYLLPENVWNRFLVSPLEMRTFVDQFKSRWVGAYFDIGNILQYGYPQDWILTLGSRIKRVHAKDYKLSTRAEQGRFVDLLQGDVDWKEVMAALVKVGYQGFISPEYGHRPEDPEYLRKISEALDKILAMA